MLKPQASILSKPANVVQPQFKVNFNDNPFNDSILNKGYNVLHAKALMCPCGSGEAASNSCQNCGGTGKFYVEVRKTKALVQGLNSSNKQEPWTDTNSTVARITMRGEDAPTYEDMVTVLDLRTNFSQLVQPRRYGKRVYGFTVYNMLEVHSAYMFVNDEEKLQILTPYQSEDMPWDYKFENNLFELNPSLVPTAKTTTVSLRYQHHPVYYVKTLDREVFHTEVDTKCDPAASNIKPMPVKCTGIRAHYVPQNNNLSGPRLWDNTDYSKFRPDEYQV